MSMPWIYNGLTQGPVLSDYRCRKALESAELPAALAAKFNPVISKDALPKAADGTLAIISMNGGGTRNLTANEVERFLKTAMRAVDHKDHQIPALTRAAYDMAILTPVMTPPISTPSF